MEFLVGALAAALLVAVAGLVSQHLIYRRLARAALEQETRLLDRIHATELRSAQQIDAMLERISTAPRIEVRPAPAAPTTTPDAQHYITDEPYMDEAWNDFRTTPADKESN